MAGSTHSEARRAFAPPRAGEVLREQVAVADFLVEPRRSSILRRFPGFPQADVEDALLFAYEQSLHGRCRGQNEFSIRAWLRRVMLRELVHQAERRGQVGLAARDEVDFDLIADARPGPEQQLLTSERCEAVRATDIPAAWGLGSHEAHFFCCIGGAAALSVAVRARRLTTPYGFLVRCRKNQ